MPFEVIKGDITKIKADAIINSTNKDLLSGGEVDRLIRQAAGEGFDEACRAAGECKVGEAVITDAFALPCKRVVHTVGPDWVDGDAFEREDLENCYISALEVAVDDGCRTIALPLLCAGTRGYPKKEAVEVAIGTIIDFLRFEGKSYLVVYLVLKDDEAIEIARALRPRIHMGGCPIPDFIDGSGSASDIMRPWITGSSK